MQSSFGQGMSSRTVQAIISRVERLEQSVRAENGIEAMAQVSRHLLRVACFITQGSVLHAGLCSSCIRKATCCLARLKALLEQNPADNTSP